ncbi:hypothetical protein JCM5350_007056 [Sporobolomyces pararoseus]
MSRLGPLLRSYTTIEDEQGLIESTVPQEIADGLSSGEWKLIEIVKGLQDSLTSENDKVRSRGVGLLSSVVLKMDQTLLDRQTTKVLTTFFTSKLSDTPSLTSCATALSQLTKCTNFGIGEGTEVVKGIFETINLKSYSQSNRYQIYLLFDSLMENSRPSLKRLGKTFIQNYCQLVEGEKDPRNLMISFSLVRIILLEFNLEEEPSNQGQEGEGEGSSSLVEDLFDITFCYFPITFTPPKDDPYGITSQDLITSLRQCLSSNSKLGPLALPLFLDKLQASSEKSKRQTLQALVECFPIYGAKTCGEWSQRFCEALSLEVFHATETSLQDLALECFYSLFKTLYPDHDDDRGRGGGRGEDTEMKESVGEEEEEEKGIVVQVVENSLEELQEPEKRDAKPAMRILIVVAASSKRLTKYVLNKVLPKLLKLLQDPDQSSLRPSILSHLSTLLESLSTSSTSSSSDGSSSEGLPLNVLPTKLDFSSSTTTTSSPLAPHKDTLLSLLTSSTRSSSQPCRIPALQGLISLITLPGFLNLQEIEFVSSTFNDLVVLTGEVEGGGGGGINNDLVDEDSYDLALSNLITVSDLYPKIIESTTLPLLFSQLPTREGGGGREKNYTKTLAALAALSLPSDLFEFFSLRMISRLEEVLSLPLTSTSTVTTSDVTLYAHHLLITFKSLIKAKIEKKKKRGECSDFDKFLDNGFLIKLLSYFILPTTASSVQGREEVVAMDKRLLVDMGKILELISTRISIERQTNLFRAMGEAFRNGNLNSLLGGTTSQLSSSSSSDSISFSPFSSTSPPSQQNLRTLYSSLLVSLHPTVPILPAELVSLLNLLLSRSLISLNELGLQTSLFGLSSLINKRLGGQGQEEGEVVREWLEGKEVKEFWELEVIANGGGDLERRKKALRVWTWICKALIVRSDSLGYKMVEQLLSLFKDPQLGRIAAEQLGVIASESDKVLCKENFSVIRLLYKQRFFTFLLPKLVDAHQQEQEKKRQTRDTESTTTSSTDTQAVYLIALSSLLQHIPKQLTLTELPKLLPLLITSLDLPDPVLRSNVIDTLGILVKEIPETLEPFISSIATKTIRSALGTVKEDRSPGSIKLRLSSLNFLTLLPDHIPYLTLHPQKPMILKELGKAIDDPKKEVRKSAVECRSKWFSYN